mmetsp:Transcript_31320/g.31860  ORF Transcript_31320/g.31860 Transcript_31320/m.31860 type:complete len:671 (+) Transcript_31320:136-2148(+)
MGNKGSTVSQENSGPPDADKNHPDNKPLTAEEFTDLSEMKRGCTDCLCLILFIASWICMTILGFIACGVIYHPSLPAGDPARLVHAVDHKGSICGVSDSVSDRPYGYYMPSGSVVCVSSCPSVTNYTDFICYESYQSEADADEFKAWSYVASTVCMYKAKTTKILNRCILVQDDSTGSLTPQQAASSIIGSTNSSILSYSDETSEDSNSYYRNVVGDLWYLRAHIFGFGLGISVVFAFLYTYFLRLPMMLKTLIWSMIIAVQVAFIVGSVLLYQLALQWESDGEKSDTEIWVMKILSYIGFALSFLYFCLILVLCKRIFLAINIVKEAAKALSAMPLLMAMPVFQVTAITIFLIPWVIYVMFLSSSGEMKTYDVAGHEFKRVEYTTNTQYAFLYFLFCWFWTSEFIVAMGQLIIALSVAKWYFSDKSNTGNRDVCWAFKAATRFHMGTAAFGSLIIAIIKTIRAIVAYFQKKARDTHNYIMQAVLCCVQCCLYCLEKCMKFINKNAYIQTAIHGYSFCKSARCAFFLILRNVLRVAAVNMVAEFLLLIGKLFVPLATTFICYLVIAYQLPEASTNGLVVPLLVTFTLSYFVASMFAEIFGMAIETILCCYIADEEMFPPEKRFADGDLKSAIQIQAEKAQVRPSIDNVKPFSIPQVKPGQDNNDKNHVGP